MTPPTLFQSFPEPLRLIDWGVILAGGDKIPYLATSLHPGVSLRELSRRGCEARAVEDPGPDEVAAWLTPEEEEGVVEGLRRIHEAGVLHGDACRPDNILIEKPEAGEEWGSEARPRRRAVWVDFGHASLYHGGGDGGDGLDTHGEFAAACASEERGCRDMLRSLRPTLSLARGRGTSSGGRAPPPAIAPPRPLQAPWRGATTAEALASTPSSHRGERGFEVSGGRGAPGPLRPAPGPLKPPPSLVGSPHLLRCRKSVMLRRLV